MANPVRSPYRWIFENIPLRFPQIGKGVLDRLAWSHTDFEADDGDPAYGPGSYEVDWDDLQPKN